MSFLGIGLLAFVMSLDAFAASMGRGAGVGRAGWAIALRTGATFGAVEAATPVLGWVLGMAASQWVAAVDHWLAFVLLAGVGGHMILRGQGCDPGGIAGPRSAVALVATALGTSVDAMAVGVSLAMMEVDIVVVALAIGATTMAMSTMGLMVGHSLGQRFGRIAEMAGGVVLAGMGAWVLMSHLAG